MNKTPVISFITICYNGFKDTCELIDSLQATIHSVDYEIIVVDNASRQNEAEKIEKRYPSVLTIRSLTNRGFSGGNNLGINIAKGKYLFLINNDTYMEADGLPLLIERLESHPAIGAVSPLIRFAASPQHIQFAGFTPLSGITLRNKSIGYNCADDKTFHTAHPSPYLHGAAMLVKREVIERIGLMPEIYFSYYDELDWCTPMTHAGYELWYEPSCTVFHKESQSTGQLSTLRTYYLTRNRLLYAWRNLTGIQRMLSIGYQITLAAGKSSFTYLLQRQPKLSAAVWRGVFAFFNLPHKTK